MLGGAQLAERPSDQQPGWLHKNQGSKQPTRPHILPTYTNPPVKQIADTTAACNGLASSSMSGAAGKGARKGRSQQWVMRARQR